MGGHNQSKLSRIRSGSQLLHCRDRESPRQMLQCEEFDVNEPINTREYKYVTPLWLATKMGDCRLAEELLEVGANPDVPCAGLKMTPLHMAAYSCNIELVNACLQAGANPNILDRWNYTPLIYAAIHSDAEKVMEMFQKLIEHGADVNFGATLNDDGEVEGSGDYNFDLPTLSSGYSDEYITYIREPMGPISGCPLHLAVQNPHLPNECLELLISAGACVNKRNLQGQTPLMQVIMDMYFDYHSLVQNHAKLLLVHNPSVDVLDRRGWSALHYAAQKGSVSCISLLLAAGAEINTQSKLRESPLWISLAHSWHEAIEYLIMSGCDVSTPICSTTLLAIKNSADLCRYGDILPIEFAITNKLYSVAELLVKAGCVINENTWLGNSLTNSHSKHSEFINWLDVHIQKKHSVKSLSHICRENIRACLSQGICDKLEKIHLPQCIKDYICLREP